MYLKTHYTKTPISNSKLKMETEITPVKDEEAQYMLLPDNLNLPYLENALKTEFLEQRG